MNRKEEKQNQFPKDKTGNVGQKQQDSFGKTSQKPAKDDLLKDREKRR